MLALSLLKAIFYRIQFCHAIFLSAKITYGHLLSSKRMYNNIYTTVILIDNFWVRALILLVSLCGRHVSEAAVIIFKRCSTLDADDAPHEIPLLCCHNWNSQYSGDCRYQRNLPHHSPSATPGYPARVISMARDDAARPTGCQGRAARPFGLRAVTIAPLPCSPGLVGTESRPDNQPTPPARAEQRASLKPEAESAVAARAEIGGGADGILVRGRVVAGGGGVGGTAGCS